MTKILVDSRELRSPIAKELDRLGCELQIIQMDVGDYCVSDEVCFERKATEDFLKSWIDEKKLFGQLHDLAKTYSKPILLIEGFENELYTLRRIDSRAVQGCLNAIALMGVPTLYTMNSKGTAQVIAMIAKKVQEETKNSNFSMHGKRSHLSSQEQLIYTLSSVTDIGSVKSKNLLTYFKSLKAVANADVDQLKEVDLIGKQTAEHIKEFFDRSY
jgi:Fanconi anemia group M protein